MRVTPKTSVSPAEIMNSVEALASPFNACSSRKETSIRAPCAPHARAAPPRTRRRAGAPECADRARAAEASGLLILARGLHLGFGEHVLGAVLIAPVLHGTDLALLAGLADPGAHGRLLIDRAHEDRAEDGIEAAAAQRAQHFFGLGRAGLVEHVLHHIADDVAEHRAEPGGVVPFGAIGVDEGLMRRLGDLFP